MVLTPNLNSYKKTNHNYQKVAIKPTIYLWDQCFNFTDNLVISVQKTPSLQTVTKYVIKLM
ncbi:hypothetical protein VCRA2128O102_50153 [Vibrio crassostreae]|nr:hypothetical protein VCRA2125O83_50152 [Vibrio crassostreae]CAK3530673.1 hypothetical protein VCRA2128O102_50153 [Vibrio crassostreae]CAK3619996.1 hypothetical protein VCRA2126O88_50103 [Vibrio crassostreae]CAK3635996.1 hypothetical protein VCRA2126O87_50153 [Vibrio crassostreae]CAK3932089.1 hypothetical protein VCRA2125O78_50152 [Vibrio crassostreae]